MPPFPLWLIPGGLDVITTNRSTVIGYTSQGTHQLIFPTALCSHPCVLQSVKPHAALQPANIIRLCLHSFLKTLVCSQHRTDEFAAGVVPCWASRYIIMLHEETYHVSSWSHQKKKKKKIHSCLCKCSLHEDSVFYVQPSLSPLFTCQPFQRLKRCQGTTLAPNYPRSPTAGRAPPTPTSSTAPWSPTSATPDISWPALRSSCASGISHGVAMYQDVKKVKWSSLVFWNKDHCEENLCFNWNALWKLGHCDGGVFWGCLFIKPSVESTQSRRGKQLYLNIKRSIWL